ncbi:MAG: BON domain-containing protein [Gammaproteobacteria bacterium]|nr:BON domain-containing protein [Gammaproteobacteria bacterium]
MKKAPDLRLWLLTLMSVGLVATAGCSRPAPEERLIEVGDAVDDTQERLQSINADINSHLDAVTELKKERQRVRASLMSLEERLEHRATDLAIFRATQSALLEEPALQQAAIVANVEDGVVTLTGSVANLQQRQEAMQVVETVPGVESTVVRLQIITDDADAENR